MSSSTLTKCKVQECPRCRELYLVERDECLVCGFEFVKKQRRKSGGVCCPVCASAYIYIRTMKYKTQKYRYVCRKCGKEFNRGYGE